MKILFLSRWFPYPFNNGSKIRVFNLIKYLSARHQVHLISFADEPVSEEGVAMMERYCRQVTVVPYRQFRPGGLKAVAGFFSRRPRSVVDTFSVEMQEAVEQINSTVSFDAVVASQIDTALYALALPGIPRVFEEVELTTLYESFKKQTDPLKKLRWGLMWWKTSHYLADLVSAFNGCTVVSDNECRRLLQVSPGYGPVAVIPNGVDVACHPADFGPPEADTLIYSGALTYYPNFEAVDFFLREIFPLIQAKRPQVKFFITGSLKGVPVNRLPAGDNVIFTGYLDDIRPRVAQSWVNVVPLRSGGGTRLKVLESLALGTPVVATAKGAEGLDLVPERDLLVADEPAEFAGMVLRLLEDSALRASLSRSGRSAVEAKYDWQSIGQQFNDFLERVISATDRVVVTGHV